ncbi:MAG: fibronectin type III domain-containing protein, partial [Thermoplasmata archaeon]|nr:fibronectin type III domain-containing protein [Thermoplasmata archaeon]
MSWTSDGAYYVNSTGELVFYSFANSSVRGVAHWLPLYDDIMNYQGIENTEWITADGAYVYEFGCHAACQPSSGSAAIVLYAVNTSTGRTFEHNFTGVSQSDFATNAEVQMIGEDGNASIAALITAAGEVIGYNIWNQTQWTLANIPYFEANNIYWVPSLNSFINVEAQGSYGDGVSQLRLTGPAPGTKLSTVYSGTFSTGFPVNGVDGLYVNVTSHEIFVTEATGGKLHTEWLPYNASGVVTGIGGSYPGFGLGVWPNDTAVPNAWSSEHRPLLTSDGPMLMGIWNGAFSNDSWLFEPSTGSYLEPNVTLGFPGTSAYREHGESPAAVENLFLNTSYEIVTESVNCRTSGTSCPIRGTSTGSLPGTIWWTWRLGLPKFPYPASADTPEALPPGDSNLSATNTSHSVTLHWGRPSSEGYPVLNYTLFWSVGSGPFNHSESLWAQNSSFTVSGLDPLTPITFKLVTWNLHWRNNGSTLATSAGSNVPPLSISPLSVQPRSSEVGALLRLNLTVAGGYVPYTIRYTGLPSGCTSVNFSSLSCRPDQAGQFTVNASVADAKGAEQFVTKAILVAPPLRVTEQEGPASSVDVGVPVWFNATVSGGVSPVSISYTGLPGGCTSSNSTNLSCVPAVPATVTVTVAVSDAAGGEAESNATMAVQPPPNITAFTVTPRQVPIGSEVSFALAFSGGTAPYRVDYSGLPSPCAAVAENATLFPCTPSVFGSFPTVATVTDAYGLTSSATVTLSVAPA